MAVKYANPFLTAMLSSLLLTTALAALAAVGISAPHRCGADYGVAMVAIFPIYIFSLSLVAGLGSLLWLPIAALPGWFWGKRAVIVEAAIVALAIAALAVYAVLPHSGADSLHCALIDRLF